MLGCAPLIDCIMVIYNIPITREPCVQLKSFECLMIVASAV